MSCLRVQSAAVAPRFRLPIRALSSQISATPFTRPKPYQSPSNHPSIRTACSKSSPPNGQDSMTSVAFWSSRAVWKRAGINTFRCLIGCSLGDFSSMWFLQLYYPGVGTGLIMGISSRFFPSLSAIGGSPADLAIAQWFRGCLLQCC